MKKRDVGTSNKGKHPNIKQVATAVVGPVQVGRRQGWWVKYDGKPKTIITTGSSAAAIEEAAEKYEGVLKRLAKR